jgi:hypothetical protein
MRPVARFTLLHVLANALLLGAGYYWLGVGEGRMSALLWSFLLALALVACTSWTYGASLVFFTNKQIGPAYRTALRHLTPLVLATLLTLAIYFLLARWASYSPNPASSVASYLTLKLRKPVSPHAVLRVFNTVLWVLRWVIVPVLLIPVLANIAARGWSGFRGLRSRWFDWLAAPVLLLCALWIPLRLLYWVPHFGSFGAEMASFISRASLAYLLFIAGLLALAFVTSLGRPRVAQPSTVVSP